MRKKDLPVSDKSVIVAMIVVGSFLVIAVMLALVMSTDDSLDHGKKPKMVKVTVTPKPVQSPAQAPRPTATKKQG